MALCEEGSEQALWACKAEGVQGRWGGQGGRICKAEGVQGGWGVQGGRICKADGICEVVGCVKRMCKMEECAWWRLYKVDRVCEVEGVQEQEV